jgi:hypothetical protein
MCIRLAISVGRNCCRLNLFITLPVCFSAAVGPGRSWYAPSRAQRLSCVAMTWEAKARARLGHQLESSLSESRDSDGDGVRLVVDGSGPMRKCKWRSPDPNRCGLSERTHKTGPRQ